MSTQSQAILLIVVGTLVMNVAAQEVAIPDPVLNAAVRQALGKSSGPLTEQDLLNLRALYICCSATDLTDLDGLGAAHNLSELSLRGNLQLTKLALPAGLTSLTSLDLNFCQLTNLVLPPDLTNLNRLDLSWNRLTDFSFLSAQQKLSILGLAGYQFTNLTLPA